MKAVVLSSGGVDSTTCLAIAVEKFGAENTMSLSVLYGQLHERELLSARRVADYYGTAHREFDISGVFYGSSSALLTGAGSEIFHVAYAEEIEKKGKVSTTVPFRNGLMLALAASVAGSVYEDEETELFIGAHADDAAGNAYADCRADFIAAMAEAVRIGTYEKIRLVAPFAGISKAEVVRRGLLLGVPYHLTWSCYEGGEHPCKRCATCRDRAAAFAKNGLTDPVV